MGRLSPWLPGPAHHVGQFRCQYLHIPSSDSVVLGRHVSCVRQRRSSLSPVSVLSVFDLLCRPSVSCRHRCGRGHSGASPVRVIDASLGLPDGHGFRWHQDLGSAAFCNPRRGISTPAPVSGYSGAALVMCVVASSQLLSLMPLDFFRSPVTTPKVVPGPLSWSALLGLGWPMCRASFSAGGGSWTLLLGNCRQRCRPGFRRNAWPDGPATK